MNYQIKREVLDNEGFIFKKERITEICSHLFYNRFAIKQEFLIQIEEMVNAGEIIKEEYMNIKSILVDNKLSWVEIEKLNIFANTGKSRGTTRFSKNISERANRELFE